MLFGRQIGQPPDMAVRDDHKVAGRVGVEVQDHEGMSSTVENEVGFAILIENLLAEDAPAVAA